MKDRGPGKRKVKVSLATMQYILDDDKLFQDEEDDVDYVAKEVYSTPCLLHAHSFFLFCSFCDFNFFSPSFFCHLTGSRRRH